jgi:MOSC domain-containing protein YiiM
MLTISDLTSRFPRPGRVERIFVRSARRGPVVGLDHAAILPGGLAGDHRGKPSPRAVTLIQAEHLPAIAALCGMKSLDPATLRRNVVVSDINLLALRDWRFRLGTALLEGTGVCPPCSRMEEILGPGGYNAMRGHGGIVARVIEEGEIRRGDQLLAIEPLAGPLGKAATSSQP